jgi:primase-polymerase (primpol)-like protein
MASVSDPETWGSYQEAAKRLMQGRKVGYQGLGYVFSKKDPFCGIDLDGVRNPETGEIVPWAWDIIRALNSYTEISPTGTGVHIIIQASLTRLLQDMGISEVKHRHEKGVEIYDDLRFFTVTAKHLEGTTTTIEERQYPLEELYYELFGLNEEDEEDPEQEPAPQQLQEKHKGGGSTSLRSDDLDRAGIRVSLTDEFIIEQAGKARGGRGATFERLWAGDASDFPASGKKDDTSRADLALCGILAYWTRCDAGQMDRLFRKSGLYTKSEARRKKWDRLGDRTINLAIKNCRSMYNPVWADEHRTSTPGKREEQQQEGSQEEHRQPSPETRKRAVPHDGMSTQQQKPVRTYSYAEHREALDASLERMRQGLGSILGDPGEAQIHLVSRPPGTGKTHVIAEMGDPIQGAYNFAAFFERRDMQRAVPALGNYLVREACTSKNCPHHQLANALGALSRNTYSVHSREATSCAYSQQDKNTFSSKIYMDAHMKMKAPARHEAIWKDEIDLCRVITHRHFTGHELQSEYKIKFYPGSTAHQLGLALDIILQDVTKRELARRKEIKTKLASGATLTRRERQSLRRSKPVELTSAELFQAVERIAKQQGQSLEGWLISLSQHGEYTNTHPYEEIDPDDPYSLMQVGTLPQLCLPYIVRTMLAELEEWQYYRASGEKWNGHLGINLTAKGYAVSVTEMPVLPKDENGRTPFAVFSDGTIKKKYVSLAYNIPENAISEDREQLPVAPETRLIEPSNSPRYGKTDLMREKTDPQTGNTIYPDRNRAIAQARYLLKKQDPSGAELAAGRVGLITFKGAVDSIGDALGIKPERRMWFWGSRGSNKLADCTILLLIGTPTMRPSETIAQARDLYRYDPVVISDEWECDPASGRPRYKDARVQELCEHQINAETTQCAHRIRPIQYESRTIINLGHGQIADMHGAELIADPLPAQVTPQGQAKKDANLEAALSRLLLAHEQLQQSGSRVTTRSLQAQAGVQMALVCSWLKEQREPTDVSESAITSYSSSGNNLEEPMQEKAPQVNQLQLGEQQTDETEYAPPCVTPPLEKALGALSDDGLEVYLRERLEVAAYPSIVGSAFQIGAGPMSWEIFLSNERVRARRELIAEMLLLQ